MMNLIVLAFVVAYNSVEVISQGTTAGADDTLRPCGSEVITHWEFFGKRARTAAREARRVMDNIQSVERSYNRRFNYVDSADIVLRALGGDPSNLICDGNPADIWMKEMYFTLDGCTADIEANCGIAVNPDGSALSPRYQEINDKMVVCEEAYEVYRNGFDNEAINADNACAEVRVPTGTMEIRRQAVLSACVDSEAYDLEITARENVCIAAVTRCTQAERRSLKIVDMCKPCICYTNPPTNGTWPPTPTPTITTDFCFWSQWSSWSVCSATCGEGTTTRTRYLEGGFCPPEVEEEKKMCYNDPCGADCVLTTWSCWTDCSKTCGTGTQSRIRGVIEEPSKGGAPCGELIEYQLCDEQECPVVCEWSPWTPWSDCSEDCGGGTQFRTRHVEVEPSGGGTPCSGEVEEYQICNKEPCPGCPAPSHVIACENDDAIFSCPPGSLIYVTSANYGRLEDSISGCPNGGVENTDCGVLTSREIVRGICQGAEACSIEASNDIFGNPCPGTDKYLKVNFLCL